MPGCDSKQLKMNCSVLSIKVYALPFPPGCSVPAEWLACKCDIYYSICVTISSWLFSASRVVGV